MDSRHTFPPIWRALLRRTASELKWFALLGTLFALILLVPAFNSELLAIGERPDTPLPGRLTLSERLGYATLLNSGLAELQPLTDEDRQNLRTQAQRPWPVQISSHSPIPNCLSDEAVKIGDQELSLRRLSISILAAEMYNRDKLIRRVKEVLGKFYENLFAAVPDFSYGVGQIKISTAKEILLQSVGAQISDDDIVSLLKSDCDNVAISGAYIKQLLNNRNLDDDQDGVIEKVAASYQGAAYGAEGSRLYLMAVLGAYHLLTPDVPPDAGVENPANDNVHFCIGFERGGVVGTDETDFASFLEKHASARLVSASAEVWTDEQKPDAYRQALETAREKWVNEKLKSLGFDPANTAVKAITAASRQTHDCDVDSFAKITLDMPWPAEETEPQSPPIIIPPPSAVRKSPVPQVSTSGNAGGATPAPSTGNPPIKSVQKSQPKPRAGDTVKK